MYLEGSQLEQLSRWNLPRELLRRGMVMRRNSALDDMIWKACFFSKFAVGNSTSGRGLPGTEQ